MGIKCGVSKILKVLGRGLYNRKAKNFNIYIDGEYLRYKGMTEGNMTSIDAEDRIAASALDYMQNTVSMIESVIGRGANQCIVYMDGERVNNKISRRADYPIDVALVRKTFKHMAIHGGFNVIELPVGESELQMYLKRDKDMDLNVFLTSDSDFLSIGYGHTAQAQNVEHVIEEQELVEDNNYIYNGEVKDSCLWVRCIKSLSFHGMDNYRDTLTYNVEAFRQFISMCGTDFTSNIITESMIDGILTAKRTDKNIINSLNLEMRVKAFIYLGLLSGGTLKRATSNEHFDVDQYMLDVQQYLKYIEFGVMDDRKMEPCSGYKALKHYIQELFGEDVIMKKGPLMTRCKATTLKDILKLDENDILTDAESDDENDMTSTDMPSTHKSSVDMSVDVDITPSPKRLKTSIDSLLFDLDC